MYKILKTLIEKDIPVEDTELKNQNPTPEDDATENKDEGTDTNSQDTSDEDDKDDTPNEDKPDDVGSIAKSEGYNISQKDMYAFGKNRKVTLLTKNEKLGSLELTYQYVINPITGAWSFRISLKNQSMGDMVEFSSGESPESLMKHLKRKNKVTVNQVVNYLKLPADADIY
jgi:hypothetical protein